MSSQSRVEHTAVWSRAYQNTVSKLVFYSAWQLDRIKTLYQKCALGTLPTPPHTENGARIFKNMRDAHALTGLIRCRALEFYSLSPSFHTQVFLQLGRRHLVEALASESALPTALAALARAGPHVHLNVLDVSVAVRTPNASPCSRRSTPHLAAILQRSCRAVLVCTRRATFHSASCIRSTPTRRVMGDNSA